MGKQSTFQPDMVSPAKRIIRADLYMNLKLEFHDDDAGRTFFMLPGMRPEGEISIIKMLWPKARILAFDRHREAVDAALKAGADEGIVGDLSNINSHGKSESLRYRGFDFGNIDLCSVLLRNEMMERRILYTPSGADAVAAAYKRMGQASVFFSYGRDNFAHFRAAGAYWRSCLDASLERGQISLWELKLRMLPDPMLGRLHVTFASMGLQGQLKRIYKYKGNSMPMLGVVMAKTSASETPWPGPLMVKAQNSELIPQVLKVADAKGADFAATIFDLPKPTIIAWKAHRTMGTYSSA